MIEGDMNIWDLKYMSTSDEEDNDSDLEDENEEGGEDEQEDPEENHSSGAIFMKNVVGQGSKIPAIARRLKLKKSTMQERVRYQYTYKEEGELEGESKKSLVIKKRIERPTPKDLVHMLTREKQDLWNKEQYLRFLKEEENKKGDSDSDEHEEENFAWFD